MATGFYRAKFVGMDGTVLDEVELTAWVNAYEVAYYFKNGAVFDVPSRKRSLEQEYGIPVFVRMEANPRARVGIAPVLVSAPSVQKNQVRCRPWLSSMLRRISTLFNF